ncbi:MAG TPA: hypothetical protein VMZ52_06820 [Bryobacteraceae bacterium]|nr:hypothetical protein [Bryobacteraceae bacterium]
MRTRSTAAVGLKSASAIRRGAIAMPQSSLRPAVFANGTGVQASLDELCISAGAPRSQAWIASTSDQKFRASFYTAGTSEVR